MRPFANCFGFRREIKSLSSREVSLTDVRVKYYAKLCMSFRLENLKKDYKQSFFVKRSQKIKEKKTISVSDAISFSKHWKQKF